ncbi:MAG: hypothetical protein WBF94_06650 [Gordonia sp. (in: high G+C Gram-positive bacteria)]
MGTHQLRGSFFVSIEGTAVQDVLHHRGVETFDQSTFAGKITEELTVTVGMTAQDVPELMEDLLTLMPWRPIVVIAHEERLVCHNQQAAPTLFAR